MGKSTISMAIFNSYVSLPEGNQFGCSPAEGGKTAASMEPGVRFLHGLHREVPVWQAIPGSHGAQENVGKCWKMMENDSESTSKY